MKNRTFKLLGSGPWFGRVFYVHVENRTEDTVILVPDEDIPEFRDNDLAYEMGYGMKLAGIHTDLLYFDKAEEDIFVHYVDNNWKY